MDAICEAVWVTGEKGEADVGITIHLSRQLFNNAACA